MAKMIALPFLNSEDDGIHVDRLTSSRTVNQMFQTAFDKAFELCLGSPWPWETDFLALSGFRDRTILLTYSWTNPCIRERSRVLLLLKIYKEAQSGKFDHVDSGNLYILSKKLNIVMKLYRSNFGNFLIKLSDMKYDNMTREIKVRTLGNLQNITIQ